MAGTVGSSAKSEAIVGMDDLLQPRDVGELLKVSQPSVRRLHERGVLPAVTILGRLRFRRSDVVRLIRGEAVSAA